MRDAESQPSFDKSCFSKNSYFSVQITVHFISRSCKSPFSLTFRILTDFACNYSFGCKGFFTHLSLGLVSFNLAFNLLFTESQDLSGKMNKHVSSPSTSITAIQACYTVTLNPSSVKVGDQHTSCAVL